MQAGQGHRRPVAAGDDDRLDGVESRAGFAQGSCWQQPAIAQAARAIDDRDLAVAGQSRVLQAIVADDHLRATRLGKPGCRHAICADHDHVHATPRMQHGFVTGLGCSVAAIDDARLAPMAAAVAAQHHAHTQTA
jgi:hypothetical protein